MSIVQCGSHLHLQIKICTDLHHCLYNSFNLISDELKNIFVDSKGSKYSEFALPYSTAASPRLTIASTHPLYFEFQQSNPKKFFISLNRNGDIAFVKINDFKILSQGSIFQADEEEVFDLVSINANLERNRCYVLLNRKVNETSILNLTNPDQYIGRTFLNVVDFKTKQTLSYDLEELSHNIFYATGMCLDKKGVNLVYSSINTFSTDVQISPDTFYPAVNSISID